MEHDFRARIGRGTVRRISWGGRTVSYSVYRCASCSREALGRIEEGDLTVRSSSPVLAMWPNLWVRPECDPGEAAVWEVMAS